jgi:hypothetical protein
LAKLDVAGKIMLADAAHTRVETVGQTLYDQGGDYLLTVKENQKGLFQTLSTLLNEQRFPSSAHPAHPCPEPGEQPGAARNPSVGLPGNDPAAGELSRSPNHRPAPPTSPAQGQEDHRNRLSHQQPHPCKSWMRQTFSSSSGAIG